MKNSVSKQRKQIPIPSWYTVAKDFNNSNNNIDSKCGIVVSYNKTNCFQWCVTSISKLSAFLFPVDS